SRSVSACERGARKYPAAAITTINAAMLAHTARRRISGTLAAVEVDDGPPPPGIAPDIAPDTCPDAACATAAADCFPLLALLAGAATPAAEALPGESIAGIPAEVMPVAPDPNSRFTRFRSARRSLACW